MATIGEDLLAVLQAAHRNFADTAVPGDDCEE
jgi:hypothetical protein